MSARRQAGRRIALAAGLVTVAACGHTDPFTLTPPRQDAPFTTTVPQRLTHAAGTDLHPSWSSDGTTLVYSYLRGTADRDRCLGVLPAGGGTRLAEICAPPLEGGGMLDAYTHGAIDGSGRIVLNRHGSLPSVQAPQSGGFQLTRADSTGGRFPLIPLLFTPPGASAPWEYLLTPAWAGPGRVVALGATQSVGTWLPFALHPPQPFDTTFRASQLVEIFVDEVPVRWAPLAPADWGTMLAVDQGAGQLYFVRATPRNPTINIDAARLADTVYRMPLGGGPPVAVHGAPRSPSELVGGIVGLAAGGGRVFLTIHRGDVPAGSRPDGATATLHELLPDGTLRSIAPGGGPVGRWGRIAASPDGRQLVAELHTAPGQADLYLLPTGP